MTPPSTQDLLKKINFIEVDVEIQKQILFSIPSDRTDEMEKTIAIIAEKTKEIDRLRKEIEKQDPDEYKRIMVFENAIQSFKQLAAKTPFESIVCREMGGTCDLELMDTTRIQCLIKACDAKANWTIITLEGETLQFTKEQVAENPPKKEQDSAQPLPFV